MNGGNVKEMDKHPRNDEALHKGNMPACDIAKARNYWYGHKGGVASSGTASEGAAGGLARCGRWVTRRLERNGTKRLCTADGVV